MRLNNSLIYIICIALGSVLGAFFCNYSYFTFEKSISYFDLLSLVVTTGVGVWLAVKIGKAFNQQNAEKALLIDEVKQTLKIFDKINNSIERRKYNLNNITSDFKVINERLILLGILLKESHCKSLTVENVHIIRKKLRRIMTNAQATNNQFTLTNQEYNLAKSEAKLLKQKCFELIFAINKK